MNSCKNCRYFLDYSAEDPEEPTGYCCHPFHRTAESKHKDYGGHWTWSTWWCLMWEKPPEKTEGA